MQQDSTDCSLAVGLCSKVTKTCFQQSAATGSDFAMSRDF